MVYKQKFLQMMVEKYGDYRQIYTDGSKSDSGVAAASCTEQMKRSITLPKTASIFTAEMQAMQLAVDIIKNSNSGTTIIFTYSHSIIQSLKDKYARNFMSRKLQHQMNLLLETKDIVLCWIPAHVVIRGNEEVDACAKFATGGVVDAVRMYYQDYFSEVKRKLYERWKMEWRDE